MTQNKKELFFADDNVELTAYGISVFSGLTAVVKLRVIIQEKGKWSLRKRLTAVVKLRVIILMLWYDGVIFLKVRTAIQEAKNDR